MISEAQSLCIAAKAQLEKQSNLSSNITASSWFDNASFSPMCDDDDLDWGDTYDEYEDFEVCSQVWA